VAQVTDLLAEFDFLSESEIGAPPSEAIRDIQHRMSEDGAYIREPEAARSAMSDARSACEGLRAGQLRLSRRADLIDAIRAEHLALAHAAFLEGIVEYLERGGGSRGSFLVLCRSGGSVIHPDLINPETGKPFRFIPEKEPLRGEIIETRLSDMDDLQFTFDAVPCRPIPERDETFELAWAAFRSGEIYRR